jgi:hypothetical protein
METEQKKFDLSNRFFAIIALLAVAICLYLATELILGFKTLNLQNQNQITVSGEGKVYTVPDVATVTLGIETNGSSVDEITEKNVSAMNKIIQELKNLGIEEKDLQTTQYSVYPQYNWTEKEGRIPDGYTISQNVKVKIRDFDKISSVLTAGTENGANIVNSLQFEVDDAEQFKADARAKAIAQAKEKARVLAEQSGIKLGDIINVYENSYYSPVSSYSTKEALGMGGAEDQAIQIPQIQTGEQEIRATVNLVYKIK